ncbi:MAG: patatin-like phospholipase family protein [Pseudomonadales bacterium]|nr:patatin-like phospholipase family protein [Pseudomonadales bacterium]
MHFRKFFILVITLGVCGCQTAPTQESSVTLTDQDRQSLGSASPSLDLGIAISGGGLRSASFSFGVLKTLYDQGILSDVDIVSTVSGGGYTGYELFINELNPEKRKGFGAATFGEENFNQRLYYHYYTANFISNWQLSKALLPKITAASIYKTQIELKYGQDDSNPPAKIVELAPLVSQKILPELVINTTLLEPLSSNVAADIYEFSTSSAGSLARGFYLYDSNGAPELSNLTAISGAALKSFLAQSITDPTTASSETLKLSDGGHSENLGAFALIRRGVKRIIIIDGEHDPKYTFGAYSSLKARLSHWGTALDIPDIENIIASDETRSDLTSGERVPSPLMIGTATNKDGSKSKLFYLKMINSNFVDGKICNDVSLAGAKEIVRVRTVLEGNKTPSGKWTSKALKNIDINHVNVFAYHLDSYPNFLKNLRKAKFVKSLGIDALELSFPQYSTADQSYYSDQFMAYVALGYFSAQAIGK